MATLLPQPTINAQRKFHAVKVDMTPMVDLGFLLITFFILTTSMMEPTVTKLSMPKEGMPVPVYEKALLTILVDKNKAFLYEGSFDKALAQNKIIATNYDVQTGLGNFIRQKQQSLATEKDKLMVAIKPLPQASYQDVMNALDEMLINNVKHYAVIDASKEEKSFVQTNH